MDLWNSFLFVLLFPVIVLADPISQAPSPTTPWGQAATHLRLANQSLDTALRGNPVGPQRDLRITPRQLHGAIQSGLSTLNGYDQNPRLDRIRASAENFTRILLDPNSTPQQKSRAQQALARFGPDMVRYVEARNQLATKLKTAIDRYKPMEGQRQALGQPPNPRLTVHRPPRLVKMFQSQIDLLKLAGRSGFAERARAALPGLSERYARSVAAFGRPGGTRAKPGARGWPAFGSQSPGQAAFN